MTEDQGDRRVKYFVNLSMTEDQEPKHFVYIVTKGQYSDYRMVAAYSTEEAAQACLARFPGNWNDARIEVLPLDVLLPTMYLPVWYVQMAWDGEVKGTRLVDPDLVSDDLKACDGRVRTWGETFSVECYARDEQHAIKIANERRLGLRTQQETKLRLQEEERP